MSVEEVALGYVKVANEAMCRPIRHITESKGFDTARHVLAAFGGAGPQHACAIAQRRWACPRVFVHRFCGILSAYGMGLADVVAETQRPFAGSYPVSDLNQPNPAPADARAAADDLNATGASTSSRRRGSTAIRSASARLFLNLRYEGTDTAIMVPEPSGDGDFARAFGERFDREYGFEFAKTVTCSSTTCACAAWVRPRCYSACRWTSMEVSRALPDPDSVARVYFEGGWRETPVFLLRELGARVGVGGPGGGHERDRDVHHRARLRRDR